jgi:starvation-inducible DNA-binding protein
MHRSGQIFHTNFLPVQQGRRKNMPGVHTTETPITTGLAKLLANTYTLYLESQNFHWHVTGPRFHSLHTMFEEEYKELALAVDEIAERIRALGAEAPATLTRFLNLTDLEEVSQTPSSEAMVKKLLTDHEIVITQLQKFMPVAQQANDEGTLDLLIKRMEIHQKVAWMLRSSL